MPGRLRRAGGLALSSLVLMGCVLSPLSAGEAIQFSPAKSKAEPGAQNNKLPKEKMSAFERMPTANPFDPANLARPNREDTRRPKTREEKRQAIKELEKKVWTEVNPGELQEEEDEKTAFGVRDYDVESNGKEKTAADIWFDRKHNDNSRSQNNNSRSRGPAARGQGQNRPQAAREIDDTDSGLTTGKAGGQSAGPSIGTPNSKELQLNKLLGGDSGPGGAKDNFGDANSLGGQGRRSDLGLRTIETQPGGRPSSLSGGDSLGFGRDMNSRAALPSSPGLLDTPRSQPSSPFSTPSGGPGFGLSGSRFSSSPFSDANLGSQSGFGNKPASPLQPQSSFAPGSARDTFAPPPRPSSGR